MVICGMVYDIVLSINSFHLSRPSPQRTMMEIGRKPFGQMKNAMTWHIQHFQPTSWPRGVEIHVTFHEDHIKSHEKSFTNPSDNMTLWW